MIDVRKAAENIAQLGMLSFFPTEQNARAGVVAIVCEMAETNDQVDWLVRRCLQLWSKWEGPGELRAVFCSKFRPCDGVDCYSQLPQFVDGIPSENERPAPPLTLAGSSSLRLLSGNTVRKELPQPAVARAMDFIADARRRKAMTATAPLPTQAEIDAINWQQDRRRTESSPAAEMVSA